MVLIFDSMTLNFRPLGVLVKVKPLTWVLSDKWSKRVLPAAFKQTDRQTDRQTKRQIDRQTDRPTDRQTNSWIDRKTYSNSLEILNIQKINHLFQSVDKIDTTASEDDLSAQLTSWLHFKGKK